MKKYIHNMFRIKPIKPIRQTIHFYSNSRTIIYLFGFAVAAQFLMYTSGYTRQRKKRGK